MHAKLEKKSKVKINIEDLNIHAHALLNLLNKLGERDQMRGLSLFCNKFNKFNTCNTGARMLDSIYHKTLKLLKTRIFGVNQNIKILLSLFLNLFHKFNNK